MNIYARIVSSTVMETFSTDGDITELCHPDIVWEACGPEVKVGWRLEDGVFFPPPPPTVEEIAIEQRALRDELLRVAGLRIAPLQDAVDLSEATEEETLLLMQWKQYRVHLNRLETQPGWPVQIKWPVAP